MPLTLHYSISMPTPEEHLFHVTLDVGEWEGESATLILPAWTPGSYLMREFARHVEGFGAETPEGQSLRWRRVDKAAWEVEGIGSDAFQVSYRVYANELTVRTSHLDTSHGYFNGANVFMCLAGQKERPLSLAIEPPAGWHVSIALPRNAQGHYEAESYDRLVDSPAEIGTHRVLRFEALGKAHEVALWGSGNEDEQALLDDFKQIVETTAHHFGDSLPYDRYLFIVHLGDNLRGGLEHRDSTTLHADRWTFRPRSDYENFLRLAAHEFYHTWTVKRIRPHNLGPFDYRVEVYTPLLWVMEGFTTYYDNLLLRRANLISAERYLEKLAERLSLYLDHPGRLVQSLEESSFTTWIKFYRQDENYVNTGISYYLKGSLVALLFDLRMRWASQGTRSLDDLMRALWAGYGARDVGFTEEQFYALLEEYLEGAPAYLERFVRGLDELPLEDHLLYAGLELERERKADSAGSYLGIRTKAADGLVVQNVLSGSPAREAGLMAGDRLVALDGYAIGGEEWLRARLGEREPGEEISIHFFRYGELQVRSATLAAAPPDRTILSPVEDPVPLQREIYESWLEATWGE